MGTLRPSEVSHSCGRHLGVCPYRMRGPIKYYFCLYAQKSPCQLATLFLHLLPLEEGEGKRAIMVLRQPFPHLFQVNAFILQLTLDQA